jgi:hypothetical protein
MSLMQYFLISRRLQLNSIPDWPMWHYVLDLVKQSSFCHFSLIFCHLEQLSATDVLLHTGVPLRGIRCAPNFY